MTLGQCCPGIWEDVGSHSPEVALSGTRARAAPEAQPLLLAALNLAGTLAPQPAPPRAGLLAPGHAGDA